MTTFARLIEDLSGPRSFPSTDPQYKTIEIFGSPLLSAHGIRHDGIGEPLSGRYYPISKHNYGIASKWRLAAFYASQYAIEEPIRHWIISSAREQYLVEQSIVAPEILFIHAINHYGNYHWQSVDIRTEYPVKTSNWTHYISPHVIEAAIGAIAVTSKMCANGQTGSNHRKFYNVHGVSTNEKTFLQFITAEFAMSEDMRNFISDWLNGAMAGFVVIDPVGYLESGDIVIEQMPRTGTAMPQWHKSIWRSMASSHRTQAAGYRREMTKPLREAAKPILREILEKKFAGSILLQAVLNSADIIIQATGADVNAAMGELGAIKSVEDLKAANERLEREIVQIKCQSDPVDDNVKQLQQLRHIVTEMNKILHEKADTICASVNDTRNLIGYGHLLNGDLNSALNRITAVAQSIKRLSNEEWTADMLKYQSD